MSLIMKIHCPFDHHSPFISKHNMNWVMRLAFLWYFFRRFQTNWQSIQRHIKHANLLKISKDFLFLEDIFLFFFFFYNKTHNNKKKPFPVVKYKHFLYFSFFFPHFHQKNSKKAFPSLFLLQQSAPFLLRFFFVHQIFQRKIL